MSAVEQIAAALFMPQFCPWPACVEHQVDSRDASRFARHGHYIRKADGRLVPRFRCRSCCRTFSLQSFAFSYYLKRADLSAPIARGLVAGSAHRQIARSVGCHHSTVTRRSQRLGRHSYLLSTLSRHPRTGDEPILVDDFDTYAGSQYFPCTLPTAVGSRSWFVYGFAFARERRRGVMSPAQKRRRAYWERKYGLPPRGSVTDAFRGLIAELPAPKDRLLELVADQDPAIARAVELLGGDRRLRLTAIANPRRGPRGSRRSAAARERDRALFANDQMHRFLRHTEAAHRRETIAFGRSYNGLLERLGLFVVWRNFIQSRSERHPKDGTTAMRVGLADRPWSWERLLACRLQPSRVATPARILSFYRREVSTPALPNETRHSLLNAF